MKTLLYSCIHGRAGVVRCFAHGYDRLRRDFDIGVLTCVSTAEDFALASEFGLNPVIHSNNPVGAKHNAGMAEALKQRWDNVLIMGSDDLLSSEGFAMLIASGRSHVGFRSAHAVEARSGTAVKTMFPPGGKIIGAGKLLSREAVETTWHRCKYVVRGKEPVEMSQRAARYLESRGYGKAKPSDTGLWNGSISRDLDESADLNLVRCGFVPFALESTRVHVVDIKGAGNINGMATLKVSESGSHPADDDWDWFLSDAERRALAALRT